ncbi:T-box transcription factor TBX20-like [Homarus americanus]|uniref:T-box transcription factor TBX20-like n=1 Tax=Homarus americanus TaxID=6706 RepID=A0A8J5NBB7_HOMAM|nr:T-box transcription factor TBX20-like [Homarus americanus]
MKTKGNCPELESNDCHLETKELWEKFFELGTEMIITKTGRRMFPTVRASFMGLKSEHRYAVLLNIVPVDNKRYRYAYHRSSWLVAGKADPPPPYRLYAHPDCPYSGDQLKKQIVSFEKEPKNHGDDCYFCSVKIEGYNAKKQKKQGIIYPKIPSAMRPVPHGPEVPGPIPPDVLQSVSSESDHDSSSGK